jgi:hypothetical protein
MAVTHKLLVVAYHLLKKWTEYREHASPATTRANFSEEAHGHIRGGSVPRARRSDTPTGFLASPRVTMLSIF